MRGLKTLFLRLPSGCRSLLGVVVVVSAAHVERRRKRQGSVNVEFRRRTVLHLTLRLDDVFRVE